MTTTHVLGDLEARLAAGEVFSLADATRVLSCADLVSVGVLGEQARRSRTGNRVTYARVATIDPAALPADGPGEAGEVRVAAVPVSIDEARALVRSAAAWACGVPVTAFCLHDVVSLSGSHAGGLEGLARDLATDGLTAVAEVRIDRAGSEDAAIDALRTLERAGVGAWRLTVGQADPGDRLAIVERAHALSGAAGTVRAFAPLPRVDRADAPSTGYDDVKTVAIARLRCRHIESIQVDWPLHGPKLAQVAIAFGANDIDGVAHVDTVGLGPRKTPLEDIRRQIRAAGAEPVERDARYVVRG